MHNILLQILIFTSIVLYFIFQIPKTIIFGRHELSVVEMTKLTKSQECALHPPTPTADLYLGWIDMQWIMDGQVIEKTESKKELCLVPEESHFVLLNGNKQLFVQKIKPKCLALYGSAPECFQTCSKLKRARVPLTLDKEAMISHFYKIRNTSFIPGTQKMWPGVFMTSFISITDEGTEGIWRDWYTGQNLEADGYDFLSGSMKLGK